MPLKKCSVNNKDGYKWGDSGKCYTGPEGKKQAIKQGLAIEGPEKFSQKVKSGELTLNEKDYEIVDAALTEYGMGIGDRVAFAINLRSYINYGDNIL